MQKDLEQHLRNQIEDKERNTRRWLNEEIQLGKQMIDNQLEEMKVGMSKERRSKELERQVINSYSQRASQERLALRKLQDKQLRKYNQE